MAYGVGYQGSYLQQQYPQLTVPQQYPNPYQQPQQSGNNMIWVQGEAAAKSFAVAPNTTVPLWDSENQIIYLKSADASGMPTIKVLEYTIKEQNLQNQLTENKHEYVTKSDFSEFEDRIMKQIENLSYRRNNYNNRYNKDKGDENNG